ncbi:MAG: aminoglycoside phosphotransferase family protein [Thiohalomonadales bacterium]
MQRQQQITAWLHKILPTQDYSCEPASSDASFRRYFRIEYQQAGKHISQILMDAPPDKEDSEPFISVAQLMEQRGINVPKIIAQDLALGFLLLTDLGNDQYLGQIREDNVDRLYQDALDALFLLQKSALPDNSAIPPPYDNALLMREMALFPEWYVDTHLNVRLSDIQQVKLQAVFESLSQSALAQPQVLVHRDFHSRNLMLTKTQNPGVLDFQDAVIGAVSYDLVSLLRDCYISWPRARVETWALKYLQRCQLAGIIPSTDEAILLRWFDWMGVQRHLKAIGIFARLNHRDGKPGYLQDIPRTLAYVTDVTGRYNELNPLHEILSQLPPMDGKEKSA